MDQLVLFCKLHLLIARLCPMVPRVPGDSLLDVESHLGAAKFVFQYFAFGEFGTCGRGGDVYRAIEYFHAKVVLVPIRAEFTLTIRRHRHVRDLDLISTVLRGLKIDGPVVCALL